MRLTCNDVTIGDGVGAISLRPSLRAAMRLHRDLGLPKLIEGLNGISLSVMTAIIEATAEQPRFVREQLDDVVMRGGIAAMKDFRPALFNVLAASFGLEPDKREGSTKEGDQPLDFGAYLERLFSIGTGWLQWSPAETYAATPAEILTAQHGKIELLRAIYGANEDGDCNNFRKADSDPHADVPLEEVAANLSALMARHGRPKVKA